MSKKNEKNSGSHLLAVFFVSLLVLIVIIGGAAMRKYYKDKQAREEFQKKVEQEAERQKIIDEANKKSQQETEEVLADEYTFSEIDKQFYINSEGTEVRDEANEEGEIIGTLGLDQCIIAVAKCDQTKYYKIKFNGDYGYVNEKDLSEEYVDCPIPLASEIVVPASTKDILFIGNSITCYPATDDWWGSGWGCGASTAASDYVHLTVAAKGYSSYDAMSMRHWEFSKTRNKELNDLDPYVTKNQYNAVVIELGENAKGNASHLKEDLVDMVKYIKSYSPNARIVFMDNFWKYNDVISAKKAAASEVGATYVSLADVWGVKDYQLQSGDTIIGPDGSEYVVNSFLAGHPNDAGFSVMAQKLISVL